MRELLTLEPLRPAMGEYAVLGASLLVMVTAVALAAASSPRQREVIPLAQLGEDAAAFAELAQVLPLAPDDVAEQVRNAHATRSEEELLATLEEIAHGTARPVSQQQLVYVTESVRDPRPAVARAAVQALAQLDPDDAEPMLREAVVHPDESVRRAALDAAIAHTDASSSAAVVLHGWYEAVRTQSETAIYLDALRQLDPAVVEPQLWAESAYPSDHPDIVAYLSERGTFNSARRWLFIRKGRDPLDPDLDPIDAAIIAIWNREVSRAEGEIEATTRMIRVGRNEPVPVNSFLQLPPPLVANVLMTAWPAARDHRGVLSLAAKLSDEQIAAIIEELKSPSTTARESAGSLLQSRLKPAAFDTLYHLAEGPTDAAIQASAVIHGHAATLRTRGDLPGEQLAQVALVTLRFPASGATIFEAISMLDREVPAELQPELIRRIVPLLISPAAVSIRGQQLKPWRELLVLDPEQMLPIVEAELTVGDVSQTVDAMMALIGSHDSQVHQRLVEGLFDASLRPVCQLCLRFCGSDVELLVLDAIRSHEASDAVIAAGCEILGWIGTNESYEDLLRMMAQHPAAADAAGEAESSIQRRRGRKVRPTDPNRRVLSEQYQKILAELPAEDAAKGDPRAIVNEALVQLRSRDPQDRRNGAFRLWRCDVVPERRSAAVLAIKRTIDPTDMPLCWFALQAYGRWAEKSAVPELVPHLSSENAYLVTAAAIALADIAAPEALEPLVELLQTSGAEVTGRLALVRAAQAEPQRVANVVTPLLDSDNRRVRMEAATVLAMLGLPEVLPAVEQAVQAEPVIAVLWPELKRRHEFSEQLLSRPEGR